jgi:hypothetical protein
MAKHRNSPHMAFWRMLKEGYDHFEVTHHEPKVDVCERHYVFDAQSPNSASLKFDAAGRCPVYKVPEDIVAAVKDKQQRDEVQFTELVGRGTATVPIRTGTDGGMNRVFLAAVQAHGGTNNSIQSPAGTIPANIRLPGEAGIDPTTGSTVVRGTMSLASADSRPVPEPQGQTGSRNLFGSLFSSKGENSESASNGVFGRMSQLMGLRSGPDPAPADVPTPKAKPPATKPTQTASAAAIRPKPQPATPSVKSADAAPPPSQQANAAPQAAMAGGLISGAAVPVPAGSFDSRWGALR